MRRQKKDSKKSQPRAASSAVEQFIALPDAEKDRIAAQYDREFSIDETEPLSNGERREWQRILRRDRARQRALTRAKVVSVRVDPHLLDRVDAYAKAHGLTRSELFSKGVEAVLARAS